MAKAKRGVTCKEMERQLGYEVDSSTSPCEFYSDLEPVSDDVDVRTSREFDEYKRNTPYPNSDIIPEEFLSNLDVTQVSSTRP